MQRTSCLILLILLTLTFIPAGVPTQAYGDKIDVDAAALKKWGEAGYVFTAKLESVVAGPVARSRPPIYSHRLTFVVEQVLRGPIKKGDRMTCVHSARQMKRPTFPQGKVCLVSATLSRGNLVANSIVESSKKLITQAKTACSIPIGWTVNKGQLSSPWANPQGDNAWPRKPGDDEQLRCAKTNRPAFLCGQGVTLTVNKIPPPKVIKWTNPDGDGEYKITVTNTTKKAIQVPALLTSTGGKTILWRESLVILCQGTTYTIPGAKPVKGKVIATELKPGQSVSTTVNALKLQGPKWPRGGYRIAFQFALGELSSTQSFYYMSRHHDKIRAQAIKQK